jgi:hypothetical protein
MAEDKNRQTDPDFKPTRGQETNENWDERNDDNSSETKASNPRIIDEQTNTSGAGSSQRSSHGNVGPLDSDLSQLPSEKRRNRNNSTGPGLG